MARIILLAIDMSTVVGIVLSDSEVLWVIVEQRNEIKTKRGIGSVVSSSQSSDSQSPF